MSRFSWPLGGDVTQGWNWWLNQSLRQLGIINIEQTVSSDPELERRIVTEVAGYGKQLGRIMDVLLILLDQRRNERFTNEQQKTIVDFKKLAEAIAAEKQRHRINAEELLDRVIEELKESKDSQESRRLIDRMRDAAAKLEGNDAGLDHRTPAKKGPKRQAAKRK